MKRLSLSGQPMRGRGWTIPDVYRSRPSDLDACPECGGPKTKHGSVCIACRRRIGRAARPIAERFWEKVDSSGGPDACWPFIGARSPLGYGRFNVSNRSVAASRVALMLTSGDPGELGALHSCDNPPCVNPSHLRPGTQRENVRDAQLRGRMPIKTIRVRPLIIECPNGHWMLGANLYVHRDGRRSCVTCRRERTLAWRKRAVA